jgi:hypothetical protein
MAQPLRTVRFIVASGEVPLRRALDIARSELLYGLDEPVTFEGVFVEPLLTGDFVMLVDGVCALMIERKTYSDIASRLYDRHVVGRGGQRLRIKGHMLNGVYTAWVFERNSPPGIRKGQPGLPYLNTLQIRRKFAKGIHTFAWNLTGGRRALDSSQPTQRFRLGLAAFFNLPPVFDFTPMKDRAQAGRYANEVAYSESVPGTAREIVRLAKNVLNDSNLIGPPPAPGQNPGEVVGVGEDGDEGQGEDEEVDNEDNDEDDDEDNDEDNDEDEDLGGSGAAGAFAGVRKRTRGKAAQNRTTNFDPASEDPADVARVRNEAATRLVEELCSPNGFFNVVCLKKWLHPSLSVPTGGLHGERNLTQTGMYVVTNAQHWLELATRLFNVGSRLDGTEMLVLEDLIRPGACFDCCLVRTGERTYSRVWHKDKVGKRGFWNPSSFPLDDYLSFYYHAWITSGCKAALVRAYTASHRNLQALQHPYVFLSNSRPMKALKKEYLNRILFGELRPGRTSRPLEMLTRKVRSLTETFLNRASDGTPENEDTIARAHRHSARTAATYYNTWGRLNDARSAVRTKAQPQPPRGGASGSSLQARVPAVTLPTIEDVFARASGKGTTVATVAAAGAMDIVDEIWQPRVPGPARQYHPSGMFYTDITDVDLADPIWTGIIEKQSRLFPRNK